MAAIKWRELGELVWVAPLAALVVCVSFSLLVLGTARTTDARREGRGGAAAAFAGLAGLGALGVLASVAFGLQVIIG